MDNTPGWVQRVMNDPESRQAYERERLILSATERICDVMEVSGFHKAELARRLGKSRANIGQMLSGSRNMTLKTLADLAYACECRVRLDFQPVVTWAGIWPPSVLQLPPAGSSSASQPINNTPSGVPPLAALPHAA